jgi:glutamate carboxypeptidase
MTSLERAAPARLTWLSERRPAFESLLEELVRQQSPSEDQARLEAISELVGARLHELVHPDRLELVPGLGRPALRLSLGRGGEPKVLLLAHLDTVWDVDSFDPLYTVRDGIAYGPGVFDMKGGLVVGAAALAALQEEGWTGPEVTLLCTTDEEVGSAASRALIESEARRHRAVLVLEPPVAGAVKTARKGVGTYHIEVEGRAAHAGLEPEKGVNAVVELAALVGQIAALGRPEVGTTVNPTVFRGGGRVNVVPAHAELSCDVRFATAAEADRLEQEMRELRAHDPQATVTVRGGANRPPLEPAASRELFALARDVATDLGLPQLQSAMVGGGSDGNFTAAVGVPTLDGLGIVGGNAHAPGEWAELASIAPRAALLAGVIEAVCLGALQ